MNAATLFSSWETRASFHGVSSSSSSRRILFVDDEEPIRNVVRDYLQPRGYLVTAVASAEEVLAILNDSPVDLVIIDIALPEVDGLELLGRIKEEHPGLPAIMFTGLGFDEELLQEAKEKGASGFLVKGLPLSQLVFEIHRVLDYPT